MDFGSSHARARIHLDGECLLYSSGDPVNRELQAAISYNAEAMRAFQVSLNGKRICVAGIGDDGVLTTNITYVPIRKRRETRLYVGGLLMPQNEHVRWKQLDLRTGDEVRLKIVESNVVDKPRVRFPRDLEAEARAEKRQLRRLARKLGWTLRKVRKPKRAA